VAEVVRRALQGFVFHGFPELAAHPIAMTA